MICKICQSKNINKIFSIEGEDFYKCKSCFIIFQYPTHNTHFKQYYTDEYFNKDKRFVNQFINWVTVYRDSRVLNLIKKYKPSGDLLDIGAAYGYFLKLAQDSGFNIFGIEPNKESARIAKERFDIDLESTFFDDNYKNPQKFDVITNFHVIEHAINPAEFIRNIQNHLKDGGIAVFETPNIQSFNAFIMGDKWPYIIPNEHLFYFSFKSLVPLLIGSGFEILYKKRTGIFIHRKGGRLVDAIRSERASRGLNLLNILNIFASEKLGLGDHLFIVARKIKR